MDSDINIKGRSLLDLSDLSDDEMLYLLDFAEELKEKKKSCIKGDLLAGKNIAMIFEKISTRTRCAAAVAAADEGGYAEYLFAGDIHLGKKESVVDTAHVLGRMFDGILFRGYKHNTVELLAQYSGVPVWNGLTDDAHPTQILADLMTIREKFGNFKGLKLVYVGDGRNNVANSLMIGAAKAGITFINCTPEALAPDLALVQQAKKIALQNDCSVLINHDPCKAVEGANIIYTDVWVSMGEESKTNERIKLLQPYQVNMDMIKNTRNMESDSVIFLHCLPAFHDNNTEMTKDSGAQEVTDDVFKSHFSCVFDEAENRMHTIKAMFVATLL